MGKYNPDKVSEITSISYEKPIPKLPLDPVDVKRAKTAWSILAAVLLLGGCSMLGTEDGSSQRELPPLEERNRMASEALRNANFGKEVSKYTPNVANNHTVPELQSMAESFCTSLDIGHSLLSISMGVEASTPAHLHYEYGEFIYLSVKHKCPEHIETLRNEIERIEDATGA